MKRIFNLISLIIILSIVSILGVNAQNSIAYGYDSNGNRTSRVLTVDRSSLNSFPLNEKELRSSVEEAKAIDTYDDLETSIKIYPNPTKGVLKVLLENYKDPIKGNFQLFDLNGSLLQHGRIDSNETEIYMNKVSNGMYVFRLTINGSVTDYKIVKQD